MFTGIVEGTGKVKSIQAMKVGMRLEVEAEYDLERLNVGESIAVNGCCLTVTSRLGKAFWLDLSEETLQKTTLQFLKEGDRLNLERPLRVGDRLGGHIVQGHVDGLGEVMEIREAGAGKEIIFSVPVELKRYLIEKGSVAIDGVSLTVNRVNGTLFTVMVIPHTQGVTTFSALKRGSCVNLEVDIVGKYVEKLTHLDSEEYRKGSEITKEFLRKHGF